MSHIAVERNRRKQMNDHLKVLRSLTPRFYVKRGDQASIIGGVVDFIKELHQILQALESKKQRKSLSPGPNLSPRPLQLTTPLLNSPTGTENINELGACCNSPIADVEAKISGANVVLKTISRRIPGQILKIIAVLEKHSFEILHLNISSMEDTVLYSFVVKVWIDYTREYLTQNVQKLQHPKSDDPEKAVWPERLHALPHSNMKIGLECQLSVEELALEVQQSFTETNVTC